MKSARSISIANASRRTRWPVVAVFVVTSLVSVCACSDNPDPTDFRAAGCYLPLADGIVVGVNRINKKVQLPLGRRKNNETARETAARETQEETGIAVDVGKKLLSVSEASVHIFLCRPQRPVRDYAALQAKDRREVKEVLVLDPGSWTNHDGRKINLDWRYDETKLMIKWLDKVIPRTIESD